MSPEIISDLAPTGVLRAGINLSNFLLVTGKGPAGEPEGVAPDMAQAGKGVWDIGLIGAEPQRAETIAFTAAYVEIEATYLVPAGSRLKTIADVDAPGVRIAVAGRSAYGLWLDRNIRHAELVRADSLGGATEQFIRGNIEALAGLRPGLLADLDKLPGARIIEGKFSSVQQAIGTAKRNTAGASYLNDFVAEAKASGLVARLIERHKVRGLSVAPPA
jgi:polar amino acid transport system substrate-binding protein